MKRNQNVSIQIYKGAKALQKRVKELEDIQYAIEEVQTAEILELLALCRIKYGNLDKDVDKRLAELELKYKGE